MWRFRDALAARSRRAREESRTRDTTAAALTRAATVVAAPVVRNQRRMRVAFTVHRRWWSCDTVHIRPTGTARASASGALRGRYHRRPSRAEPTRRPTDWKRECFILDPNLNRVERAVRRPRFGTRGAWILGCLLLAIAGLVHDRLAAADDAATGPTRRVILELDMASRPEGHLASAAEPWPPSARRSATRRPGCSTSCAMPPSAAPVRSGTCRCSRWRPMTRACAARGRRPGWWRSTRTASISRPSPRASP
jgi:hypothetical protein